MAKKSSDELLSDILNLLDDVIKENKKAAKNAGVSNTPNMAILSYDAANMKVLGDSLKILSSAIVDIGKVSEKQITGTIKTIKQLGEAIQSIKITKEDSNGIIQMASTLVALNGLFSQMSENFFKTYFSFSPLKAKQLGNRLAKFYKIVFKKLKELTISDTIKALQDIPDDKKFSEKILNLEKLIKIIRDIPMKDILKMWTMGMLVGEKTGANIGKFFAAIIDSLTKNDPDGKKAEKAIGIAKSITKLVGTLTISLVIMVGLAFIDHKKLLIGIGLLVGLIGIAFIMMNSLSSKKFKNASKDGKKGALGIAILLGALTLSLTILILVAKTFPVGSILLGLGLLVGLIVISYFMMNFLSKKQFQQQSKKALLGVAAIILMIIGMSIAMLITISIGKHAKEIISGGILVLGFTAVSILLFKWMAKSLKKSTIIKGLIGVAGIALMIVGISMSMMIYAEYLKKIDNISLKGILAGVAITAAMIGGVIGLAHIMAPLAIDPFFWAGFAMVETISLMIASVSGAMLLFTKLIDKVKEISSEDIKNAIEKFTSKDGLISALSQIISELSKFGIKAAIKAGLIGISIRPVISTISQFVDVVQKMASLKIADEWDKNGKPTHYLQLTPAAFKEAAVNLTSSFSIFLTNLSKGLEGFDLKSVAILKLLFPPKNQGLVGLIAGKRAGIGDVIPVIGQFIDIIIKMATLSIPTKWNDQGIPIKYRQIKNQEFKDAAITVIDIFKIFLTELSEGLNQISNASYLKFIINQLFPAPIKAGIFSSKTIDQPGIGSVIQSIGSFMDIIIKMSTAVVPDKWDSKGNPIHFKKIDSKTWIESAIAITTCFTTFLTQLSESLKRDVNPLGLLALKMISSSGIDKIAETIVTVMQPIMQIAAGQIQVGDKSIELNIEKLNSGITPIIDSFIYILSLIKTKFNENGWKDAKNGANSAFYMISDFSRAMAMLFSKDGKVAGGKSDGKDFLIIDNVTLDKINLIDPLINMLYSIKLKFNENGWKDAKNGANSAFYMVSDFSQAMAMLFSEDGKVNGKSKYLMLKNVTDENYKKYETAKMAVLNLAEYINKHEFNTNKSKAFSEQMDYAKKGISTIQPLLNNTPAQMLNIAKSLRALDVELIEKQKQRTEAIQSVSNNFKDMAENIQKLNDTLAQSMNLMNNYNRMRLFSSDMMQQKGAQAIVNATQKVKDTVQHAVEHTKTLATNIGNKEDKKTENMKLFADIVSQAISTALDNWASQNKELVVKFDESPKAIFGNIEMG